MWTGDGQLLEYRSLDHCGDVGDGDFNVGGVRYAMESPMTGWRLTAEGEAPVRACRVGAESLATVPFAADLRFTALTPPIGSDGEGGEGPHSAQSRAASGSTGKGHFEQAGRWAGTLTVDGRTATWSGGRGNRDKSWGPRRWGGPSMWRWFSINVGDDLHLGGIRLGTAAGDLHRGWCFDAGRTWSVAAWDLTTELAADGLTQRALDLVVRTKSGPDYRFRGDVLRVADIGRAGGTVVNEGLTRWTYLPDHGEPRVGFGVAEYLHQLDADGRPQIPVA